MFLSVAVDRGRNGSPPKRLSLGTLKTNRPAENCQVVVRKEVLPCFGLFGSVMKSVVKPVELSLMPSASGLFRGERTGDNRRGTCSAAFINKVHVHGVNGKNMIRPYRVFEILLKIILAFSLH